MTSSTSTIKTLIEGVEVEAVVVRSKFAFTVKVTSPFKGKESFGPHIPFFLRPFHSFDGEYGDQRILEVLRSLYEQGVQGVED